MSKRRESRNADLIEARVAAEQEWCWAQYVAGYPYPKIRALSTLPLEEGGLGLPSGLSVSAIRSLVAEYRVAQGQIIGTREERIERRQIEYDEIALHAKRRIAAAAELGAMDKDAVKVLLDARAAEARMHGDDAAQRIEAEVTTRDGVMDDLNAALVALGREPVEVE